MDIADPTLGHTGRSGIVAAIDVGTNSIHMVVARPTTNGFEVVAREKDVVRLGSGGAEMTELGPEAIDRGVAALYRMRQIANSHGATVRAVATSAVREADNADVFLRRAATEADVTIEVISGNEEARLIHLGVRQAIEIDRGSALVVDIGGGSTEFIVSHDGHIRFAQSLKLGAVRLTNRFLADEAPGQRAIDDLRAHVSSTLAAVAHEVRALTPETTVVSSGTAETLVRLAALRVGRAPRSLNGHRVGADEIDQATAMLLGCRTREERAALDGVDDKRADIIVAGAVLFAEIMHILDIDEVIYSDFALREGLLLDTVLRGDPDRGPVLVDARRDSVTMLARRCSVDLGRAEYLTNLADALFRCLQPHFHLDVSLLPLLEAATTLWSTGLAISHSRYHVHSHYIVSNADLMGFSSDEIDIIALACRYHRKSMPKPTHDDFAALTPPAQRAVEVIAGILRIVIGLDRSHDQSISALTVRIDDASDASPAAIAVEAVCGSSSPAAAELNGYAARKGTDLLERTLATTISVHVVSVEPHDHQTADEQ